MTGASSPVYFDATLTPHTALSPRAFMIVMGLVESTFILNFIAFTSSVVGVFLGVIGTATYVGERRRENRQDEWPE